MAGLEYCCDTSSDPPGSRRKGTFHGQGILKYRNGGIYEGNFQFRVKHGFGTLSSASGFRYSRERANGEQTGLGSKPLIRRQIIDAGNCEIISLGSASIFWTFAR